MPHMFFIFKYIYYTVFPSRVDCISSELPDLLSGKRVRVEASVVTKLEKLLPVLGWSLFLFW